MEIKVKKLNEYLEQNIWNPKYLFHGSPYEIDILEPLLMPKIRKMRIMLFFLQVGLLMLRHMLLEIN